MPTVKFSGRITPPIMTFRITHGPVTLTNSIVGPMSISYRIDGTDIAVTCEIESANDENITVLSWHVRAMVCGVVDAIAFQRGIGATAVIDHCEKPDGTSGPLGMRDEHLENACTVSYRDLIAVADKEGAVFKLINDLIEALIRPWDAPVNCARAVEGLRKLMYPIPADQEKERDRDKREWTFMRDNLNLTPDFLRFVTDLSALPRHGFVGPVLGRDIGNTRIHAWTVASRFIEFRKRGNLKLPESDFPLR
jgi:hypothetical protein